MSVDAHYFSPTTPGADSFDVDVSEAMRRGRIGPLSKQAQLGSVGSGIAVLDDVDGTLGEDGDGIVGLKQWYMNETACPSGNQRFFTGYTFDRSYYRANSLVQGDARTIDVTLMDPNAFLSFRVFAPEDVDATSSFNRPEEGHITRIQAMLGVDFLSTTLFDLGYIPSGTGVLMSAKDYKGSRPLDVLNDCAQASGWNGWVGYDETENKLFLWFNDWKTDGVDTVVYDSAIKLTNVQSERDADPSNVLLFELNARETRSPSRVVSAVYGAGTGIEGYQQLPSTANTFGWRDMVAPAFFVKEQPKLDALLIRYLTDNATEDIRISLTVQVPVAQITAIKEGQRIQVHGTHMKSVAAGFTWTRILHMSIRRDIETMEFYWVDLEVSPVPSSTPLFAALYRAQSADGGGPIGWACSGDVDGFPGCNTGVYVTDPTVGLIHPTTGSTPGTSWPTNYVGLTIDGTGTIDIQWGGVRSNVPITAFGAASGHTITVDLLLNGVIVGTTFAGPTAGGSSHPMSPIIVTGLAVAPGDVLTAEATVSPPSLFYIDYGDFIITGGVLA